MTKTHEGAMHYDTAMDYLTDIYKRIDRMDRKLARIHERGKVRVEDLQAQIDEMKVDPEPAIGFHIHAQDVLEVEEKRRRGRPRTPARGRSQRPKTRKTRTKRK